VNNPVFSEVSCPCKHFIHELLRKDPHNRPTAEQAASKMWSSTEYLKCRQHTWTSNAVDGFSSRGMSLARGHDQFMVLDHYDPHASSSCIPNLEREEGPAEEDNTDSTSDMEKGRHERKESRMCKKEEPFCRETSNGVRSIVQPAEDHSSSVQPPSHAHGGPNPPVMRGHIGRLLQALRSTRTQEGERGFVVPPASRPERARTQAIFFQSWLSRRRNRKEDH